MRTPTKDLTPVLSENMKQVLEKLSNARNGFSHLKQRSRVILLAAEGKSGIKISKEVGLHENQARKWRRRFLEQLPDLRLIEELQASDDYRGVTLKDAVIDTLSDKPRSGKPSIFTAEQVLKIINLACQSPSDFDYEVGNWTLDLLVEEIIKSGIAETISRSQVSVFLKYK